MIYFNEKWLESRRFIRPKTLKIENIVVINVGKPSNLLFWYEISF